MRTVKVRIAVVVNEQGHWNSCGWFAGTAVKDSALIGNALECLDGGPTEATYFIEAELPVPEPKTVEGRVVE